MQGVMQRSRRKFWSYWDLGVKDMLANGRDIKFWDNQVAIIGGEERYQRVGISCKELRLKKDLEKKDKHFKMRHYLRATKARC